MSADKYSCHYLEMKASVEKNLDKTLSEIRLAWITPAKSIHYLHLIDAEFYDPILRP